MASKTPCLVFRAANHWYAIPANQVVSVSGPLLPVRVPRTPPFVRGVIVISGKVVPVIALASLLGEAKTRSGEVSRLVLVHDGTRQAACEVAEVQGINELPDGSGPVAGVPPGVAAGETTPPGDRLITRLEATRLMDLVASAVQERA